MLFTVNTVPSLFAFWSCKKFDLYKFLNFYVDIQSFYIVKNRYDFYKQEGEGQSFRTAHKGILLKVVAWITELLPDFYSKNKNTCPSNQYPLVNGTSHWDEKLYLCPGPRCQQTSPKGQIVNILDILGHTIFIVETQLSYYTAKVAISNTYENLCVVF